MNESWLCIRVWVTNRIIYKNLRNCLSIFPTASSKQYKQVCRVCRRNSACQKFICRSSTNHQSLRSLLILQTSGRVVEEQDFRFWNRPVHHEFSSLLWILRWAVTLLSWIALRALPLSLLPSTLLVPFKWVIFDRRLWNEFPLPPFLDLFFFSSYPLTNYFSSQSKETDMEHRIENGNLRSACYPVENCLKNYTRNGCLIWK